MFSAKQITALIAVLFAIFALSYNFANAQQQAVSTKIINNEKNKSRAGIYESAENNNLNLMVCVKCKNLTKRTLTNGP